MISLLACGPEHVPDVVGLLRRDWGDDVAVGVAGDGEPWGAEVAVLEASSRVVGHCSWDVDRRGSCELTFLKAPRSCLCSTRRTCQRWHKGCSDTR